AAAPRRAGTPGAGAERAARPRPAPRVPGGGGGVGGYGPPGGGGPGGGAPAGDDFLAGVCRAWEAEAARAQTLAVRVVRLRIGIVLGPDGGALGRMLVPFRAGIGGPLGGGRQVMSWIHRDDVIGLVQAALAGDGYLGAVNATAPHPVTNREFASTLGRVLSRPAFLPTPALVLRLALGEMADMLLSGQRVLPRVASEQGYVWKQATLEAALRACLET